MYKSKSTLIIQICIVPITKILNLFNNWYKIVLSYSIHLMSLSQLSELSAKNSYCSNVAKLVLNSNDIKNNRRPNEWNSFQYQKRILRNQVCGMQTSSCKLGVDRENRFRERVLPFCNKYSFVNFLFDTKKKTFEHIPLCNDLI